jgi:hypothetical protein
MKNLKTYDSWLNESSGDLLKPRRGKPLHFDHRRYPELAGELFNLITIAYSEIGGHAKIKSPEDIFSDPDWNFWEGTDIHGSQDFDIVIFGQKTKFGVKFSGVGHDGAKDSKKEYLDDLGSDLKNLGYYIESSGKFAEILMNKYGCPVIEDEETVVKVLGKQVQWIGKSSNPEHTGNGWYIRNIGGHPHEKILIGRPKS